MMKKDVWTILSVVLGMAILGQAWGQTGMEPEPVAPHAEDAESVPQPGVVGSAHAGRFIWVPALRRDAATLVLGGRFSADVQEFVVDGLLPIWQPGEATLFGNLRGTFLEGREQEISAGLVMRRLSPYQRLIVGLNTYFDARRTHDRNTFSQVGAGVEVLSPRLDFRANLYHSLSGVKLLKECVTTEPRDEGGSRITTTTMRRRYEEALDGFDAEVGVWLPVLSRWAPTALYAGYYRFNSDYSDDLKGARVRVESRVHPNVTLDAEWFEDKALNGTDYFAGFRLHIPLGSRGTRRAHPPRFEDRLTDMVYRDFRIRTLKSGPVIVGQTVQTESLGDPAQPPAQPPAPVPQQGPQAPAPPPNCYLDSEGEVICD